MYAAACFAAFISTAAVSVTAGSIGSFSNDICSLFRNRFLFFLNSRLRGREIDHLLDLLDFLGLGASAKQWVERVNLTQLVLQSNNHVSNRLPMLQSTRDYLESVLCTCYASMLRTLGQKPHRDCAALSEAQLTHINGTRVPQVTGFHCGIRMQCYASRDPMPVAPGA